MKKILVVIDAQQDFVTGSLRNEDAIKVIPNLVKKIREFDGDAIFYTLDTHDENYLSTKEGQKLPVVHCVNGTDGWKLDPNVEEAINSRRKNEYVRGIEKPTFGSFSLAPAISSILDPGENFDIEIVGFCTDICVVTNALILKAYYFNRTNISVIENCCAGVTPETHFAACKTMQMCQIDVI